jgi:hypothetical protein
MSLDTSQAGALAGGAAPMSAAAWSKNSPSRAPPAASTRITSARSSDPSSGS